MSGTGEKLTPNLSENGWTSSDEEAKIAVKVGKGNVSSKRKEKSD